MANIVIQSAVVNNKGLVRKNNEDNFYMHGSFMTREKMDDGAQLTQKSHDDLQLYAVCDGMGGADCGEEASFCAASELAKNKDSLSRLTSSKVFASELFRISEKISREADQKGQKSGTTINALLLDNGKYHAVNVGDSRTYLLRNDNLTQISLDDTRIRRMVEMGLLTPEQARTDPKRHVITQFLGMPPEIKMTPHCKGPDELMKDDIFLLCSDGLSDMVEDTQIYSILRRHKDPAEAAKELVDAAIRNGGRDNVTVMVLRVAKASDDTAGAGTADPKISMLRRVLTIVQILAGGGLLVTAADLIYYLLSK